MQHDVKWLLYAIEVAPFEFNDCALDALERKNYAAMRCAALDKDHRRRDIRISVESEMTRNFQLLAQLHNQLCDLK